MSEEEAIEWVKALLQDKEKYEKYHSWVGTNTFVSIQTLLNLIEKQQRIMKSQETIIMEQEKEIDNYKKQEFGNLFNGRYVSKDKIREKIHEIGSETQYLLTDKGEIKQNYAIRKFYELLGEQDE